MGNEKMTEKIRNLVEDEGGAGILGALCGGLAGALTEAGIFLFDIFGVGCCNAPGIYPWTALHIFPLTGLTIGGSAAGGIIGTIVDGVAAVGTAIGTVGCVGSSIASYLAGMLFTK